MKSHFPQITFASRVGNTGERSSNVIKKTNMQNTPPPSHSLSTGLNEFQVALFKMPYLENQDKKMPLRFYHR